MILIRIKLQYKFGIAYQTISYPKYFLEERFVGKTIEQVKEFFENEMRALTSEPFTILEWNVSNYI